MKKRLITLECQCLIGVVPLLCILVLGSKQCIAASETPPSRTVHPDQISIDFQACEPARVQVWLALGSTVYEIVGQDHDKCLMRYGHEVENPKWDGSLQYQCQVPTDLGKVAFSKRTQKVDFSSIQIFCTSTK
jgi:hypothetical protein